MARPKYSTAGFAAVHMGGMQRCKLVHAEGPQAGKTHVLDGSEVILGNGTGCHVMVQHSTVSRQHLAIWFDGTSFMIKDLGSTNGTYVNGVRIKEAYLHPGVVIHAGQVSFRLESA